MKNNKIINFHIPTFLVETLKLENEINELELLTMTLNQKLKTLEEQSKVLNLMNETIAHFSFIAPLAFPQIAKMPVVKFLIDELSNRNYDSYIEFEENLSEILYRIFFSEGKDKVFDIEDIEYFNEEKFNALKDQGIRIPRQWLDHLILCFGNKDMQDVIDLHFMTPKWMWPKFEYFFTAIISSTIEFIKSKENGKGTILNRS